VLGELCANGTKPGFLSKGGERDSVFLGGTLGMYVLSGIGVVYLFTLDLVFVCVVPGIGGIGEVACLYELYRIVEVKLNKQCCSYVIV
jgi:hypothetical protein